MDISVSKADVIWSYLAQFFNIGAGFITLPLILNMLSTEEIAMNYLMLTVGSMVALIDFGFAPQFGRNITYVFSGAQTLEKNGLNGYVESTVNYHLLKNLIVVAKKVYIYMSIIVLCLMMTFGTWYIYSVTEGFTLVPHSFFIWALYSVSTFFNIYFFYYSSLLTGRGQIQESKKALLAQKVTYIVLTYCFLLFGLGLIGVCLANLIAPFVNRWLCYRYFYDSELSKQLQRENTTSKEQKELFWTISYNAKKLGINFVGAYAILKFSLFIAGLYLSSSEIASYGLLTQLVGVISAVSMTFFNTFNPEIASYRVNGDRDGMLRKYAMSMNIYYILFILGSIILVLFGPFLLNLIGSKADLPNIYQVLLFLFITLLEGNHGQAATFIATGNTIPFVKAALIAGFFICFLDVLVLQYTDWRLWGIVGVQGLVQILYNNWYWPRWTYKELNVSFPTFIVIGFQETIGLINRSRLR